VLVLLSEIFIIFIGYCLFAGVTNLY